MTANILERFISHRIVIQRPISLNPRTIRGPRAPRYDQQKLKLCTNTLAGPASAPMWYWAYVSDKTKAGINQIGEGQNVECTDKICSCHATLAIHRFRGTDKDGSRFSGKSSQRHPEQVVRYQLNKHIARHRFQTEATFLPPPRPITIISKDSRLFHKPA